MRLAEVDVEMRTREPGFIDYLGRDPEFFGFQPPEPCSVRLTILCFPAEAQAFLNMLGQDINPPTRAAASKNRQLPEQGEPEVVACVVEQPKALPPGDCTGCKHYHHIPEQRGWRGRKAAGDGCLLTGGHAVVRCASFEEKK